jgi:ribosome-associated translation inhibitor RaiA
MNDMDVRTKMTEYQMTPEVSDHLDGKLAQIEKTLGGGSELARLEVELGRATGHHKHSEYLYVAELQLIRPGEQRLVASNHEPTIDAAIDNANDELLRQLRQEKRLHARVWRRGGALAKRLLRLE